MTVVFNPTNEDLRGFKGGIEYNFPKFPDKGHKVKLDDAAAAHLLNHLGPRGLCKLEYGDEEKEDEIGAGGLKRNADFKEKQIAAYNHHNEFNKQQGHAYVEPTSDIKRYAEELGKELFAPYTPDTDKEKRIAELLTERSGQSEKIEKQSEEIKSLSENMEKMMETMASFMTDKKEPGVKPGFEIADEETGKKGDKKKPKGG